MSMKRLFGGTAIKAQMHSLHSECKNVQKIMLTNVNWQRNASPYFQMFTCSFLAATSFADSCQFSVSQTFLGITFVPLNNIISLIITELYLQILDSASASRETYCCTTK